MYQAAKRIANIRFDFAIEKVLAHCAGIWYDLSCENKCISWKEYKRCKARLDTALHRYEERIAMREEKTKYYVIKEKAVPEVLLKVIEAKRLMDMQELTVQQATEKAGISRSSFYKYKDDILPFHDNAKGKTITFILQMDDEPGLLSDVLKIIAEFHGNILTIHQTIPLNGVASLTISVDIAEDRGDASEMINEIESRQGVHYFKILGQES